MSPYATEAVDILPIESEAIAFSAAQAVPPSSVPLQAQKPPPVQYPDVGGDAQVIADRGLNLRAEPGMSGQVLAIVNQSRYVQVVGGPDVTPDSLWYKVDHDGDIGWVAGIYLRSITPLEQPIAREQREKSARERVSRNASGSAQTNVRGAEIARHALSLVGSPYAWAGTNPRGGFDCSGLVWYVMRQAGLDPGRTSYDQAGRGTPVRRNDLQLGDLVVFGDTYESGNSHTGIYVGSGKFVHSEDYATGVILSSVSSGYWGSRYVGARRIL